MEQTPILPVGKFIPRQRKYSPVVGEDDKYTLNEITGLMNTLIGRLTNEYQRGVDNRDEELIHELYSILESKMIYNHAMITYNQNEQDIEDIKRMYTEAGANPEGVNENYRPGYGIDVRANQRFTLEGIIRESEAAFEYTINQIGFRLERASPFINELYNRLITLRPRDGLEAKPFNFNEDKNTVIEKLQTLLKFDTAPATSLAHKSDIKVLQDFISRHKGWGGPGSYAKGGKRRNKKKNTRKVRKTRKTRK